LCFVSNRTVAGHSVAADRGQRQSQVTVIGRRFGAASLVGAVVGRCSGLEAAASSSRCCVVGSLMGGSLRWVFILTNTFELGTDPVDRDLRHSAEEKSADPARATVPVPAAIAFGTAGSAVWSGRALS